MSLNIGENIRRFRREMGLTQEQLAEAVGVSVAAVSKWEKGLSSPDIAMLPLLADFFETSVDVLLGYAVRCRTAESAAERIRELRFEKSFEEGAAEAEKALLRFPNRFDVVCQSASLFAQMGVERRERRTLEKALELYRRSCGLIAQNTDETVSELSLQKAIGTIYASMGETETALAHLKKHNACGVNDSDIGLLLSQTGRPDEALEYLSKSYVNSLAELFKVTLGFVNAYHEKGETDMALDISLWMYETLEGVRLPDRSSYLERLQVILLCCCAHAAGDRGDPEAAERFLRRAAESARAFDAAPDYGMDHVKFYQGKDCSCGDDFGETALAGIDRFVREEAGSELLREIWRRIQNEQTEENT
ncbi:MAG: helix-turn-helix domain-containing protein [Oscillospiraceae bacterium]